MPVQGFPLADPRQLEQFAVAPDNGDRPISLVGCRRPDHACGMFVVSESDVVAIRAAWEHGGELAAVVELRRLFPALRDNARAALCAATIARWKPLKLPPA